MKLFDPYLTAAGKTRRPLYMPLITVLLTASVFLIALSRIQDTDAWLHLSLGRLIWQLKAFPAREMFTYPTFDQPFSYTSWLFGLISYMIHRFFGVYGLELFKASAVATAFFLMFRDSVRPYLNYVVPAFVLSATVVILQFRFVLRPEILMMGYISFSIFSLNAYMYEDRKYVYALPLVHLLWANTHSSINLMFVPFGAFILGGAAQIYIGKKGVGDPASVSRRKVAVIGALFVISLAASLLNPNSFHQYLYAGKVLAADWYKKVTVELHPPVGADRTMLFVIVGLIISSFVLNAKRISFIHLLLVLPFLYLPFLADRFIVLIGVIGGPVLARNISGFIESRRVGLLSRKKAIVIMTLVWIVLYCSLTLAKAGPFGRGGGAFGFGFDYSMVPRGAVEYLDSRGIYDKVMNEFSDGQYIIWTGYPRRTVFIDGRGALPEELLYKSMTFRFSNAVLDDLYNRFGFETIVMPYARDAIYGGKHKFHFMHPQWALVYWDDTSMVFLKRGGRYENVVGSDEYKFATPDISLYSFIGGLEEHRDDIAEQRLAEELKRNIRETDSSLARTFLGSLYAKRERGREAVESFSGIRRYAYPTHRYIVNILAGQAYEQLGNLSEALWQYDEALGMQPDTVTLLRTADLYLRMNRPEKAVEACRKALQLNSGTAEAYPLLIRSYQKLGLTKEAAGALSEFQSLQGRAGKTTH